MRCWGRSWFVGDCLWQMMQEVVAVTERGKEDARNKKTGVGAGFYSTSASDFSLPVT